MPAPESRRALADRLGRAVRGLPDLRTPVVVVDLDAFDANADDLLRRAGGTPVRVASKSLRVPALLARALARPGFHGVMAYTLREALWLVAQGVADDVLVAYPTVDRGALARWAADPRARSAVALVVDDPAHLDLLDATAGAGDSTTLQVVLDVDAGWRPERGGPALGARWHVGPRRSPLREPDEVAALGRDALARGLRLRGVMTYEGQVAGVPDQVPGQRLRSAVVRRLKTASLAQLRTRRAAVAEAVAALPGDGGPRLWNAGGSGDVAEAAADPVVTEVAAGSGLLVPGLFDHYRSFVARPAAYLGVPVVRRPGPGVVTVAGGGFVASGATGRDRSPLPWAPEGLRLTALEGAGEVQTPLTGPAADGLAIGDLVWWRHAKAGELMEHADVVHLVRGNAVVDTVPTYRGLGLVW